MEPVYALIRQRAREIIARFPTPSFYKKFPEATAFARRVLDGHPLAVRVRRHVAENLKNDFGHGLDHALKVSLDAGALVRIEGETEGYGEGFLHRRVLLAVCAGLLHDIRRRQEDHSRQGAEEARRVLDRLGVPARDVEDVAHAVRSHEAFRPREAVGTPESDLLADCLYDADKFRWGPDNFSGTVWEMVSSTRTPLSAFLAQYPRGMQSLAEIRSTFRTGTGRRYGPEFIDIGIAVGIELYAAIRSEFSHLL